MTYDVFSGTLNPTQSINHVQRFIMMLVPKALGCGTC